MQHQAELYIIGLHADSSLSTKALKAISSAKVVYGGARHHQILLKHDIAIAQWRNWQTPLQNSVSEIESDLQAGKTVAVIASGDPMCYGIGVTLARELSHFPITVWAAPSSFSLAANALVWSLQDCHCLSLHQGKAEEILSYLGSQKRLLCLSKNQHTPRQVAELMITQGMGSTTLWVLENLCSPAQNVRSFTAQEIFDQNIDFSSLNVLAIDQYNRETPSCDRDIIIDPDRAFSHDGMLSKFAIRAVTLAALHPKKDALLWDIGAGCGSISIGWCKHGGRAIAVEPHPDRQALIRQNSEKLLGYCLPIYRDTALKARHELPQWDTQPPQAIFLGGGLVTLPDYVDALHSQGVIVANAVTLASQQLLVSYQAQFGGTLRRLSIEEESPIGPHSALAPLRSVLQYQWIKP